MFKIDSTYLKPVRVRHAPPINRPLGVIAIDSHAFLMRRVLGSNGAGLWPEPAELNPADRCPGDRVQGELDAILSGEHLKIGHGIQQFLSVIDTFWSGVMVA
jgi:hypothetical protein